MTFFSTPSPANVDTNSAWKLCHKTSIGLVLTIFGNCKIFIVWLLLLIQLIRGTSFSCIPSVQTFHLMTPLPLWPPLPMPLGRVCFTEHHAVGRRSPTFMELWLVLYVVAGCSKVLQWQVGTSVVLLHSLRTPWPKWLPPSYHHHPIYIPQWVLTRLTSNPKIFTWML